MYVIECNIREWIRVTIKMARTESRVEESVESSGQSQLSHISLVTLTGLKWETALYFLTHSKVPKTSAFGCDEGARGFRSIPNVNHTCQCSQAGDSEMFNFLNICILKLKRVTDDEMVGWHHQFNGHELGKLQETVRDREAGVLQSMGLQTVGHDWATKQQQNI